MGTGSGGVRFAPSATERNREWRDEARKTSRYAHSPVPDCRACLDCGAQVASKLLWLHDEFHDSPSAASDAGES